MTGSNDDIWIGDLVRGSLTPETRDPGEDGSPVWSPDGRRIAFATEMHGSPPKLAILELGSGVRFAVDTGTHFSAPTAWSATGEILVAHAAASRGSGLTTDIGVMRDVEGGMSILLQTGHEERFATPSPGGRWLAYASDESGRMEVYIRSAHGDGPRQPVSRDGGVEPKWSHTGERLYYRNGDRIFSVDVDGTDVTPNLSAPEVAFRLPSSLYLTGGFNSAAWDLSTDERRILALQEAQHVEITRLRVVLNFSEEAKAKVGN